MVLDGFWIKTYIKYSLPSFYLGCGNWQYVIVWQSVSVEHDINCTNLSRPALFNPCNH